MGSIDQFDSFGDVLGFFLRGGDHGGDGLADKTHLAIGEHRLADRPVIEFVQHRRDLLNALQVSGGDNRRVVRRHDLFDFPGGDRATHDAHPICGWQVGGEAAIPGDQRGIFQAADGAANPVHAAAFGMGGHVMECSSARRTTARTRSRR